MIYESIYWKMPRTLHIDDLSKNDESRILVVESSDLYARMIKAALEKVFTGPIDVTSTFDEVKKLTETSNRDYFLSLLNLSIPGAPAGEAVAYVRSKGIAAVVFTSSMEEETVAQIKALGVIDYIFKESAVNLDYMSRLVRRIHRNRRTTALIVDDSLMIRMLMRRLLEKQLFNVMEAEDGEEALEMIRENDEIALVVVDYQMPKMDGFEFIKKLRGFKNSGQLAIVGISAIEDEAVATNFMRYGADDFSTKPIRAEEFSTRISLCMDRRDLMNELSFSATTDFLTGLSNRRHFLSNANVLYASAKRGQLSIFCAMLDIDFFKNVNDTYGHDAGDEVLKTVAGALKNRIRDSDLIARFGGEEFCLLAVNVDPDAKDTFFNELRTTVSDLEFDLNGEKVHVTVSIGVCETLGNSIEDMISTADSSLYDAKEGGRNKVIFSD